MMSLMEYVEENTSKLSGFKINTKNRSKIEFFL